jgi:hypothetical protein
MLRWNTEEPLECTRSRRARERAEHYHGANKEQAS